MSNIKEDKNTQKHFELRGLNSVAVIWLAFLSIIGVLSYLLYEKQGVISDLVEVEIARNNGSVSGGVYENLVPKVLTVKGVTRELNLPDSFDISVLYEDKELKEPRAMALDDKNNMYLTDKKEGKVYVLQLSDKGDEVISKNVVDSKLTNPHGVDYFEEDLYVATEDKIIVYDNVAKDGSFLSKKDLVKDLPKGGDHKTRTIKIGPDKKIYLTIGSSCNVCEEKDDKRATMMRYNLDGSGGEVYATGLRNTVDFVFRPEADDKFSIYGLDNSRDGLGENIPPDEVNIIEKGKHYGWPYCYGAGIADPKFPEKNDFCKEKTVLPQYELQAHSAPLGLDMYPKEGAEQLIEEFGGNMVVAYHGSWNRAVPTGYKLVRLTGKKEGLTPINFITGWLGKDGKDWGRPVDVKISNQGQIYITDDKQGVVYVVTHTPK
jgi:glucose/arabinose dehydrogenase